MIKIKVLKKYLKMNIVQWIWIEFEFISMYFFKFINKNSMNNKTSFHLYKNMKSVQVRNKFSS